MVKKVADQPMLQEEDSDIASAASHDTDDTMSDSESVEDSASSHDEEQEKPAGNAGWADAISKVLRTNKPKRKKTLVLSRAKKLCDVQVNSEAPDELGFEVDGEIKEETEEKPVVPLPPRMTSAQERERKRKRKVWENLCRTKPDVLDKDREKALSKIATRGVVQLFNAVRQQQRSIETGMKAAGSSERRQEKVLQSVDKNSFLDILMGPTRSTPVGRSSSNSVTDAKPPIKDEDTKAPLWSVLRDDFLVGGKLKDWDRDAQDGGPETAQGESDSSEESSEEESD